MPGRLAKLVATKVIHPLVVAYLTHCVEDDEEPDGGGKPGYDPRGTIAADTAVAANRDHYVLDVTASRPFGFGRAHAGKDRDRAAPPARPSPWASA